MEVFMSRFAAGLVAAVPLSVLGIIYVLIRGRALVEMVMADDPDTLTEGQWKLIFGITLAMAPFAFGLLSALVYGAIGSSQTFMGIAAGAAVLASVLAILTRTPMTWDKVGMNAAVGLVFGLLIPVLSRGN